MHELSITLGIVDIAEKEARKANASEIELIELEIGVLSGVEIESLKFVWQSAVDGTILEHAKRQIHSPEGKARCLECGTKYLLKNRFDACPKCKSHFKNIYQGKELRVKAITVK